MEMGPKKSGLTINVCFPDVIFLLFKKAASSKRHHNLSLGIEFPMSQNQCRIISFCVQQKKYSSSKISVDIPKEIQVSVQVGSHKISMTSEFFSKPAKLKIAWAFKSLSFWLIQIRSKKTLVGDLQNIITTMLTTKPEGKHQGENGSPGHPRSMPGRIPKRRESPSK